MSIAKMCKSLCGCIGSKEKIKEKPKGEPELIEKQFEWEPKKGEENLWVDEYEQENFEPKTAMP